MEQVVDASDRTSDEPAELSSPPATWQGHLIALACAALDAVRVATAALAAYQLAKMMGAPGIEHESILNALSLWHLVGIYLTSAVLTFVLGRMRTPRNVHTTQGGPDQDASAARTDDPCPIA